MSVTWDPTTGTARVRVCRLHDVVCDAQGLSLPQRQMASLIAREFDAAGLSKLNEAAIVNAYAESGLDPWAVSPSGASVGLFQLHEDGLGHGMSARSRKDPATNVRKVIDEVNTSSFAGPLRNALARGASRDELVRLFTTGVMRPKDKAAKAEERVQMARQIFPTSRTSPRYGAVESQQQRLDRLQHAWYVAAEEKWPYLWGGGGPGVAWGRRPVDCSGFVTMALEHAGLVPRGVRRWGREAARALGRKIAWGQQRPGDIVTYPGHVELVWTWPNAEGDSQIIGASGNFVHVKRSIHSLPNFEGIYRVDAESDSEAPRTPAPSPAPAPAPARAPAPAPEVPWTEAAAETISEWMAPAQGSWSTSRPGLSLVSTDGSVYPPGKVPAGVYSLVRDDRTLTHVEVLPGRDYEVVYDEAGRGTWQAR